MLTPPALADAITLSVVCLTPMVILFLADGGIDNFTQIAQIKQIFLIL